MTSRFCTVVAMFALLTLTAPAHAALVEIIDLNLTYPGSVTLTGNLDIQLSAPSVPAYLPQYSTTLSVNGTLLSPFITGGVFGGDGTGYLYYSDHQITYPTLTFSDPNYGDPLLLTVSDIRLDGLTALSGTVRCTAECTDAVSPVPLPAALPLFGSALLALGAFAWRRKVSA